MEQPMARNVRLSRQIAQQIRTLAAKLDTADMPSDAATAQELLLALHDALRDLREPPQALLAVATTGNEEMADLPASADRRLVTRHFIWCDLAGCWLDGE
ncbi:hypothetical protein J2Z21_000741 [Streptomyces griseochromogenes]|uniref:Uncharacterized protein n=2 Tax=Streptomyces griseochromogenes TaxID=68214 RepID=A0ABS4LKA0_9ACTN|nr:hypothetical protein [Streptomyces griseochromogenes]MBP2047819.1 hypothetical protein [Streptomyces griseochromogenes]